jgi:hypothetical protein
MNTQTNNFAGSPRGFLITGVASILLFVIIFWAANIICQWNFYNTYIEQGFPVNLAGESFGNRLLLTAYGSYSIRFTSKEPPPYLEAPVTYSAVVGIKETNQFHSSPYSNSYYSLEAQPLEAVTYLRQKYPTDLSSLINIRDLSYFHCANSKGQVIEHRYLIRNNKTNVNFFFIQSHYTGT